MKFALISLLVVLVVVAASESRIACTPNFCQSQCRNAPTKEDCQAKNMEYRPNTTICGCCATCVEYIEILGECGVEDKDKLLVVGGSPPVKRHCKPGAQCVDHKCLIIMH